MIRCSRFAFVLCLLLPWVLPGCARVPRGALEPLAPGQLEARVALADPATDDDPVAVAFALAKAELELGRPQRAADMAWLGLQRAQAAWWMARLGGDERSIREQRRRLDQACADALRWARRGDDPGLTVMAVLLHSHPRRHRRALREAVSRLPSPPRTTMESAVLDLDRLLELVGDHDASRRQLARWAVAQPGERERLGLLDLGTDVEVHDLLVDTLHEAILRQAPPAELRGPVEAVLAADPWHLDAQLVHLMMRELASGLIADDPLLLDDIAWVWGGGASEVARLHLRTQAHPQSSVLPLAAVALALRNDMVGDAAAQLESITPPADPAVVRLHEQLHAMVGARRGDVIAFDSWRIEQGVRSPSVDQWLLRFDAPAHGPLRSLAQRARRRLMHVGLAPYYGPDTWHVLVDPEATDDERQRALDNFSTQRGEALAWAAVCREQGLDGDTCSDLWEHVDLLTGVLQMGRSRHFQPELLDSAWTLTADQLRVLGPLLEPYVGTVVDASPELQMARLRVELVQGRFDDAERRLREQGPLLRDFERRWAWLVLDDLRAGRVAYDDSRFGAWARDFRSVIAEASADPAVAPPSSRVEAFGQGLAAAHSGQDAIALELLLPVLDAVPDEVVPDGLAQAALAAHRMGDAATRDALRQRLLAAAPNSAALARLEALLSLEVDQPEVARRFLAHALRWNPGVFQLHGDLLESFDHGVPSEAVAMAYIVDGAPEDEPYYGEIRRAIREGTITSLRTAGQARRGLLGDDEQAWQLGIPLLAKLPELSGRAVSHGVAQVEQAEDLASAQSWANATIDLVAAAEGLVEWRRHQHVWLSLLAGRVEEGLAMADRDDPQQGVLPLAEGDAVVLLLRARGRGEVDDALAWDLWRWVNDVDPEASARVEALLEQPPPGTLLQVFACSELSARDDVTLALGVCADAWAAHPGDPVVAIAQLYLSINHPDPTQGEAIVQQVISTVTPPTFAERPEQALRSGDLELWHANLASWLGNHARHQESAAAWWQAYAFGLDSDIGRGEMIEQMPWRGPLTRQLVASDEQDLRERFMMLARLSLHEPDPVAAKGYADAARVVVPDEPGALTREELMRPDQLRHLARWAADDLAAARVAAADVGPLVELVLAPELEAAQPLHQRHPESSLAMLAVAEALRATGDAAAAAPLAEPLVQRHPRDPLAAALAIPLRLHAGDEDGARALYVDAHAEHPGDTLLLYVDAPESITGRRNGVPVWVRDPAQYDARVAAVGSGSAQAQAAVRYASDERAAEMFVPRAWVPTGDRPLRFTDEHGARMMVITSPRASRCLGEACARDLVDDLAQGGRTRQWMRQTSFAGGEATEVMFTNAEEVLVAWVLPSGGRVFTVVLAAPVDRFEAALPALVVLRDGFRPLDGVLPPFAAESLRAIGPRLGDGFRLRARREQLEAPAAETCPVPATLASLEHDHQRAELLVDLWLATTDVEARRRLLRCTKPRQATSRRLALVALLDEDPRVHAFGRRAVLTHASQVDADVRTILSSPLSPPVSAPDYLTREDLPSRGLVEVLGALPPSHAGPLVERLLASKDPRDQTLAWAAVRLRPALATDGAIDEALAGDHRLRSEAAYLLSDRGRPEDDQRLRRALEELPAPADADDQQAFYAVASALAARLEAEDGPRLKAAVDRVLDGDDAKRADHLRERMRQLVEDHQRGVALLQDPALPTTEDDGRPLYWRDQKRRSQLPLRSEQDLRTKSLAEVLPGNDWVFARLAAPGLFSSTVADVLGRLTTDDEAVDQRLSDMTDAMLRSSGFAALSASGGLDASRPIECARPFNESGWLCTAHVTDRNALLAVLGQREHGSDAGIALPLTVATTAGIVPVVLSAFPAVLHAIVYDQDDDEDDDRPAVIDQAAERVRMTIEVGGLSLERYSIVDVNTRRISIDSERYLFLDDRLWVFSTESAMDRVMRQHEGPALAEDARFQQLTSSWHDGSALQAVALGRAWSLAEGGASMEVVLDDRGLHFRYAGALPQDDAVGDIGPALAQLPEGAVSIFAHGLGPMRSFADEVLEAEGPDAARVPPVAMLAKAQGIAFGWYFEEGDRLWRHWLAVAPLDDELRAALRKAKTPPGRGSSRRHGSLCYRERAGYLLVGDCELVDRSAALPEPPPPSREQLRVGHGIFDGAVAAKRLPELDGLPMDKQLLLRTVSPLLNVVTDLRVGADWLPAQGVAVLEGHVGLRLRPPGDHSGVIDDWLAATETRNAAGLPRKVRSEELEGPLRYVVEVPDADDFVHRTLAQSPRIEAEVLGPTRARFTVVPVPRAPAPVPLSPEERKRLTKRTNSLRSDDPQIVELARSLAPEGTPPQEAAERISQWVHERMTYEVTPRSLDGAEILAARRGDCSEYATLTVTLLRAAGVPAEVRDGMAVSGEEMVAHAWVGYHDGTQWHEIDPTWGRKTASAGHLEMSVLDALALISLGKLTVVEIGPG